eukprot:9493031-Pyramimonas_sp.AAC.1
MRPPYPPPMGVSPDPPLLCCCSRSQKVRPFDEPTPPAQGTALEVPRVLLSRRPPRDMSVNLPVATVNLPVATVNLRVLSRRPPRVGRKEPLMRGEPFPLF